MIDNHTRRGSSISLSKFRSLKITSSLGHRRFSSNQLQIHPKRQPGADNLQHPFQNKIMQISSRELVLNHKTSSAYRRRPKEDLLNSNIVSMKTNKRLKSNKHIFQDGNSTYIAIWLGKEDLGKFGKCNISKLGRCLLLNRCQRHCYNYSIQHSGQKKLGIDYKLANNSRQSESQVHIKDALCFSGLIQSLYRGDLRYHLSKHTIFTQGEAKFMVTSILLALEYLHQKMIIHRDIKPQNIVFDSKGYAHLTDFGISRYLKKNNKEDTSGTPGYMAPQVLFHQNHGFEVDFYAVGIIMYEIMMGKRPYDGRSREQVKQQIKNMQKIIQKKDIPDGWSIQAADFTNQLLQRKAIERLGWGGIQEVKKHPWIVDFPWADLANGKLEAPKTRNYDFSQVKYRPTDKGTQFCRKINQSLQKLQHKQGQNIFKGYEYNYSNSLNTIRIRQN